MESQVSSREQKALLTWAGGADADRASDEALVARARQGDTPAFEQLYLRHRDRVYALCLHLCRNEEEAQDLLQESFVRANRALATFRGEAHLSTWLHRIAVNLHHDQVRAQRRRERLEVLPPPSAPVYTGEALQVRSALAQLRPVHRSVLVLFYAQGLSYQEMAELLRWSLGRVKVTLHRARAAFREIYLHVEADTP
jgi:RNA polymerase sigma-70 factor, ECF subfamily